MAKNDNPNKVNMHTPRVTLKWPKLTEPDHGTEKYPCKHEAGEYKTKIVLERSKAGAAAFLAKIDAQMEVAKELAEAAFKELPVKDRKRLEAAQGGIARDEPYSEVYDEQTEEPTGEIELMVKMIAGGKRKKDNKPWSAKPGLFDARGKPISKKIEIWGGTTAIVNFDLEPYFVAGTGKYGLSRRLNAVQIIELVASGGQRSASSYGFGAEEDGFSADEYVADDDDATDGPADSGSADDDDPQF